MITKFHALFALAPSGGWIQDGDTTIWMDGYTPISEEEIVQKIAELEYQEEVNEYQRQRAAEYPSYADQFDQIYHEGVDAWKASIQAIKDKYPKQTMDAAVLEERQNQAVADMTPAEEAPEETPEEEAPAEEE